MSRPVLSFSTDDRARNAQLRNQGYLDGRAGRAARWPDATYQEAWRRGRANAAEAKNAR